MASPNPTLQAGYRCRVPYARRASTDGEIGTRLNFIYWLRVEKSGGVCDRSVLLQRKVSENTGSIRSRNRRGALQWSAVLLEFEA